MATPEKRPSSTIGDVVGPTGLPDAPGPRFDAGLTPQFDTLADEARKSAAVARAHADWVASLEENPPAPTMDPAGASAYPENAFLIDASPEQIEDLGRRVRDGLGD